MRPTEFRPAKNCGRITVPLALRLFLGMVTLIVLAVGTAVIATYVQGRDIVDKAVGKAVDTSAAVQRDFAERRLEQLQLIVRLIAADADFVKYIADAAGTSALPGLGPAKTVDTGSMRDLLGERRADFGIDLAILLDADGDVLARTDQNDAFAASLANDPLVARALTDIAPFSGYWRQGDRLYQAAIMPLDRDQDLVGFLLVALTVNDELAKSVARISKGDVAFWLPSADGVALIASSLTPEAANDLNSALAAHRRDWLPEILAGKTLDHLDLEFNSKAWAARIIPADDGADAELGSVSILVPTDQITSSYHAILNRVALAGLVAVLIAILLSILFARRILKPITGMAEAAEAAAAGNYHTHIGDEGSDVLGRLSAAFDSLLSDLREKSDMQGYVGQMARFLPDPGAEASAPVVATPTPAPVLPPQRETLAMLATEFRHLLGPVNADTDPQQRVDALIAVQHLLANIAAAEQIELQRMDGGRWRFLVDGERRLHEAARIWALLLRDCQSLKISLPAGALVEGELVRATDTQGGRNDALTLGTAIAHADRLLCDAAPGELLFTRPVGDALKPQLPEAQLRVVTGSFSAKKFYALDAACLPAIAAQQAPTRPHRTVAAPVAKSTARAKAAQPIAAGTVLGDRYRVIVPLGEGGMGVVYKAHDLELDDVVALKMLRPGMLVDEEQLERLKSEIKLARRITHPNVLRTFDFGEVDGRPYISMEYVRGMTLRYLLSEAKQIPFAAALRISRQLAAGLAAAHAVGVLHRDIKPENLILEANGNVKLMDFGIARPTRRSEPGRTEAGTFVGTPNYCSPEQLSGGEVDERSDIFACGVVMSEVFCGGLPFPGGNTMAIYQAQLNDEPMRPSALREDIPAEVEAVILRCLRCDPSARYPSATELARDLGKIRS